MQFERCSHVRRQWLVLLAVAMVACGDDGSAATDGTEDTGTEDSTQGSQTSEASGTDLDDDTTAADGSTGSSEGGEDSTSDEGSTDDGPAELPSELLLNDNAAPEDVVVHEGFVYVSDIATGSVLRVDLADPSTAAEVFVAPPDVDDTMRQSWGLRVDAANGRLLAAFNEAWNFQGPPTVPGQLRAFDLQSGELLDTWELPAGTVGNPVVVDDDGYYYVGDIGPNVRIIRVDPATDEVEVWCEDPEVWATGGFGLGGMVYDGEGAIYGIHAPSDLFYRVPIEADGSAGSIESIAITDANGDPFTGLAADGMSWAGDQTIYYAQNDAFVPGPNGTVYRVELDGQGGGTIAPVQTALADPSGVFAASFEGADYLFVNESQLGYSFGVDEGMPDLPYRVLVFPQGGG